jgi:putative flippase GtrA
MRHIRGRFRQLVRYSAVSLISTIVSVIVLGVLVGTNSMSAGWANVVATACGTIPSFELNRRWVWKRHGGRRFGAEVIPFTGLSFAGLGLSTLAVSFADTYVRNSGWSNGSRTIALELASNAAFASLWVLQFVVLDRVLFRAAKPALADPDVSGELVPAAAVADDRLVAA